MSKAFPQYQVRQMLPQDFPAVIGLWLEENYSEGTYSINTWYEIDPEGFLVAVDEAGIVIGAIAGVLQKNDLVFIGLYVVKSNYRGCGIGKRMWNAVMERAGDRNVGLDSVPTMLQTYREKAGFTFQCTWQVIFGSLQSDASSKMCSNVPDVEIKPLTSNDGMTLENVINYDEDIVGFSRRKLIPKVCDQKESVTLVALREGSREVCGYGNIKKNIKGGALVGPLYADDEKIAEALLCELMKTLPNVQSTEVRFGTVDCNHAGMNMFENLGMKVVEPLTKLYTKEEVTANFKKIFILHTLNFAVF